LRRIIVFILLALVVSGSPLQIERAIYSKIFHTLLPNKGTITVYSDRPREMKEIFRNSTTIRVTDTPQQADLWLLYDRLPESSFRRPVVFARYVLFSRYRAKVAGAFYWQKGRPNVVLCREWFEGHRMALPGELRDYMEQCGR